MVGKAHARRRAEQSTGTNWRFMIAMAFGQGYRYHFLVVNSAFMEFLDGYGGRRTSLASSWVYPGARVNEHATIINRSMNDVSSEPFLPLYRERNS